MTIGKIQARMLSRAAAASLAVGLLSTAAAAQQSRPFNAGNACGDAQGYIQWAKGALAFNGTLRDFNARPASTTHLYITGKGLKRHRVATVRNGQEVGFKGSSPTDGTPKGVLMTVCSNNCWHKWDCGRPG